MTSSTIFLVLISLIPKSYSEISTPSNHEISIHRPLTPKQPNRQTAQLSLLKDSHIGDNKIVASLSIVIILCHSGISIRKNVEIKNVRKIRRIIQEPTPKILKLTQTTSDLMIIRIAHVNVL